MCTGGIKELYPGVFFSHKYTHNPLHAGKKLGSQERPGVYVLEHMSQSSPSECTCESLPCPVLCLSSSRKPTFVLCNNRYNGAF